jgi:hypothetical protein
VGIVLGLAIGGMTMSSVSLATCVTHVSLWPLVTLGNLGAMSCLLVV